VISRLGLALAGLLAFGSASAVEMPFSQQAYDQAMQHKAPVIVDFFAGWCPTCRIQRPLIKYLASSARFDKVLILVANYDLEKPLEKSLNIGVQGTIVVFKGGREVGRDVGELNVGELAKLFSKAL